MATIVWVGLDRFMHKLERMTVETPVLAREGMKGIAEGVLEESKRIITDTLKHPDIDTGEVVDSGHVESTAEGADVVFDHRAAGFVEEGIRGNEPHRGFLSKPADAALPEVDVAMKEAIEVPAR